MTANKRKKNSRLRSSRTHGWGSHKKHRGAGSHGGAGMAGTGKRADSKKPSIWKQEYFGKHGFRSRKQEAMAINVGDIEKEIRKLILSKKIKKENEAYIIDLKAIGYDKLLGKGKTNSKIIVTVKQATKKAMEKITKANGEVRITKNATEKHPDEPAGSSES